QNMGAMVAFYRDKLGLEIEGPADLDDYSGESWVLFDAGATKLALHSGGQGRTGEDTPMIVFAVADVAASRAVLVERGVEFGEPFEAAPGITVA
ncbi:MAG: hypothetical protein KDE01_04490, partial [Caldilineaceae bacterium]|nr:hypothetical protein [Caldilineaceae bacterium]